MTTEWRTLFVSDIHLGITACQATQFLDFLRENDATTWYLVGDIVDIWALKRCWYWPQEHNDVIQKLLRKVRAGAKMIYVPGNHDEILRDYCGVHFGGIHVKEHDIYVGLNNKRYLVIHGDLYDAVITHAKWLAHVGDKAYTFALWFNCFFNLLRQKCGLPYWSISQWAKLKIKNAVSFIGDFEHVLSNEAKRNEVQGVICGHIHHAVIHEDFGLHYINCGDWVESLTAIGEDQDGKFHIIKWSK